jgi:hypothetical protein
MIITSTIVYQNDDTMRGFLNILKKDDGFLSK